MARKRLIKTPKKKIERASKTDIFSDIDHINVVNKVIDELQNTYEGCDLNDPEVQKRCQDLIHKFTNKQGKENPESTYQLIQKPLELDQGPAFVVSHQLDMKNSTISSHSDSDTNFSDENMENSQFLNLIEKKTHVVDLSDFNIFFRDLNYFSDLHKLDEIVRKGGNISTNHSSFVNILCDDQPVAFLLAIPCRTEKKIKKKAKAEHLFTKEIYKAIESINTQSNGQYSTDQTESNDIITIVHGSLMDLPGKNLRKSLKMLEIENSTLPIFFISEYEKLETLFSTNEIPKTLIVTERAGDVGFVHFIVDMKGFITFLDAHES